MKFENSALYLPKQFFGKGISSSPLRPAGVCLFCPMFNYIQQFRLFVGHSTFFHNPSSHWHKAGFIEWLFWCIFLGMWFYLTAAYANYWILVFLTLALKEKQLFIFHCFNLFERYYLLITTTLKAKCYAQSVINSKS